MRPLVLSLAAVAALAASGCSRGYSTPEELYEEIVRVSTAGDWARHWALLTDDQRRAFAKDVEVNRITYEKNPGARNSVRQFNVTLEEYNTLPPEKIWERAHTGLERVMIGAKVVGRVRDPANPDSIGYEVEMADGMRVMFVLKNVPSKGWLMHEQRLVRAGGAEVR